MAKWSGSAGPKYSSLSLPKKSRPSGTGVTVGVGVGVGVGVEHGEDDAGRTEPLSVQLKQITAGGLHGCSQLKLRATDSAESTQALDQTTSTVE